MQMHLCDVRYEKLPEEAKFIVLFRDPEDIFLTRYRRYCNSSWTEYARVPREKITLELFAAGMFANMHSGNEAVGSVLTAVPTWSMSLA